MRRARQRLFDTGYGTMDHRDLHGYGEHPPHARWPDGARVAVSLVLNIEEGSEYAVSRGDDRNELIYEMIQEPGPEPDLAMESHFDYGPRAGYWRIARVLRRYGATCTLNFCAEALERTPWIAEDGLAHGYEIGCHGDRWASPRGLSEGEEAVMIARAVERIRRVAGVRPVGWHSRCPHTPNTRRLLVEEAGFIYDSEAYDDDLPYIAEVAERQHVVVPYSLDTNDMRFQRPDSSFARARDFSDYVIDAFDWLWEEGETTPRMMSIALHTRIIGLPARIAGLDRVLAHIRDRGGAWIARRDAIARHWLATHGGNA